MNIQHPLTEEDIGPYSPFDGKKVVARIYKNGLWFTGHVTSITASPECKLRIEPIVGIIPRLPNFDLMDNGDVLVHADDKIVEKSLSDKSPPFTLVEPVVMLPKENIDNTIIIGFTDGSAIISTRDKDIGAVDSLIESAHNTSR